MASNSEYAPGDGGSSGVSGNDGSSGNTGDATASTSDAEGGTSLDGSTASGDAPSTGRDAIADQDMPDLGPPPTPNCPQGAKWGTGTQLSISTTADDVLGAITPDELSIVWISTNGSTASVLYADRSAASSAFGTPASLPTAQGYYAPTKVALSPNGLRAIAVQSSHTAFGVTARSSRSAAFTAAPGGGEVDMIDLAVSGAEANSLLDDPVIGASDTSLYYSLYGAGSTTTLFESTRSGTSAWPGGTWLMTTNTQFAGSGSVLAHPTGVSADDLTLFYWDDAAATQMAAWRPFTSQPFNHFETLANIRAAAPNATCTKLYYSAPGSTGGLDLFVAPRQ
jgi:hypothetical protein